jgi:hypothetical protein
MDKWLFRQLAKLGYARHDKGYWYAVEENIASIYMAYVASAMCGVVKDMQPVTDQPSAIAALTPSASDEMTRLRELRYVTIMSALPVPSSAVPVDELRSFKDVHQEKLRRLRHYIDGRLADLAAMDSEELREVKAGSFLDEIRDDVAVLREQMDSRKWPRVVTIGIGGVVGSGLAAVSGISGAGGALAMGLAVGGGTVAVSGSLYQTIQILRESRFNKRAPLAYAALAAKL